MMLLLLASCNVDEFIDSNEAQSTKVQIADDSVIEYEITPNLETPLKLKLWEDHQKRKLWEDHQKRKRISSKMARSSNSFMPPDEPISDKQVLNANLFVLDGELYGISPASATDLYLYSSGKDALSGFSKVSFDSDDKAKFRILSAPASSGYSNLIKSAEGEDLYLGSGKLNNQQDIAYVRNNSGWGAGWDIKPKGNGYFIIENSHAFKHTPSEGGGYGSFEYLVLDKANGGETHFRSNLACLNVKTPNNDNQSMRITPSSDYIFKGVRFFGNMKDFNNALYDKKSPENIPFLIEQCDIEENVLYPPISIEKVRTFTSTREYNNDTNRDQEYDMYFDDKMYLSSRFSERKGLNFKWATNTGIPLPYIKEGEILSSNLANWTSVYNRYGRERTLQGMLPLVISPRTEVKVTYTYALYRVTIPYIIYLESLSVRQKDDNTPAIGKIVGLWTGDIVAQDLIGQHHYERKKKDDSDEIEFGIIEDEIDFRTDNKDYHLRSSSPRKRIRL